MAKTKYKIGQMIASQQGSGIIEELRVKRVREEGKPDTTEVAYIVENGSEVEESTVTAVFRPVAPRKPKAEKKAKKTDGAQKKAA